MFGMGRLFWKFFGFLLTAQIAISVCVGVLYYLQEHQRNHENNQASANWLDRHAVATAASVLEVGKTESLEGLLKAWQHRPVPQVYALDANGHELLNRPVSQALLRAVNEKASDVTDASVRRVRVSSHQYYILFVPTYFKLAKELPSASLGTSVQVIDPSCYSGNQQSTSETVSKACPPDVGVEWVTVPLDGTSIAPHPMRPPLNAPMFPTIPLVVGAIASLIFAWLLAAYFAKPIRLLKEAFGQASEGALTVRVSQHMGGRQDELTDLGRDFDQMAERLNQLIQGQTRLLHHVSHELRSPLARMQMALGLAHQNPANIQSTLDRIERETCRMDQMVSELLELSRLESGVIHLRKEPISIGGLLSTIVEDAQFEAQAKQMQFSLQLNQTIETEGQADLLYRAIENVVRNAIKYGPEKTQITLQCEAVSVPPCIRILVQDQGAGVLEKELDEIFKPFIRGHTGSQTVGHGVGLAITKQVVESHGGWVQASNLKPTGFQIEIRLPLLRRDA